MKLELDVTRFLRDISAHIYAERVQEDYQSGVCSGVNRTPTFFTNSVRYEVAYWDALLTAIEDASNA